MRPAVVAVRALLPDPSALALSLKGLSAVKSVSVARRPSALKIVSKSDIVDKVARLRTLTALTGQNE